MGNRCCCCRGKSDPKDSDIVVVWQTTRRSEVNDPVVPLPTPATEEKEEEESKEKEEEEDTNVPKGKPFIKNTPSFRSHLSKQSEPLPPIPSRQVQLNMDLQSKSLPKDIGGFPSFPPELPPRPPQMQAYLPDNSGNTQQINMLFDEVEALYAERNQLMTKPAPEDEGGYLATNEVLEQKQQSQGGGVDNSAFSSDENEEHYEDTNSFANELLERLQRSSAQNYDSVISQREMSFDDQRHRIEELEKKISDLIGTINEMRGETHRLPLEQTGQDQHREQEVDTVPDEDGSTTSTSPSKLDIRLYENNPIAGGPEHHEEEESHDDREESQSEDNDADNNSDNDDNDDNVSNHNDDDNDDQYEPVMSPRNESGIEEQEEVEDAALDNARMFVCQLCGYVAGSDVQKLREHLAQGHDSMKEMMTDSMKAGTQTPRKMKFRCNECGFKTTRESKYLVHLQEHAEYMFV